VQNQSNPSGDFIKVDDPKLWVPIMKACELAQVSRRTIYNWMKKGQLEVMRTAGGSRRIYVPSLFRNNYDREAPNYLRNGLDNG
jgi:excisionase family DNA binding protein